VNNKVSFKKDLTKLCECGCGTTIKAFRINYYPVKYVKGHQKSRLGKKHSIKTKEKISKSRTGKMLGSNNHKWKTKVGYHGLHTWVQRRLGKAKECSKCGSNIRISWSNISYQYKRELGDWEQLCQSCHFKKDYHSGFWGEARRMFSL
jgi:hypothetical protein